MESKTIYIGDSVYARHDMAGGVVLWLDNGLGPKNEIVLELGTLDNLLFFIGAEWKQPE